MKLPDLKFKDGIVKTKQVKFGGLNCTAAASDGELVDMKNLTSDHSPVLSVRDKRKMIFKMENPGGMFFWGELCWADGEEFYYCYDGDVVGAVSSGEKTFAHMGGWIVILPDKLCYNVNSLEMKQMEANWHGNALTFGNGKRYGETAAANAISCAGVNWNEYFRAGDAVEISGCKTHPENNISAIIREIEGQILHFSENVFTLDGTDGVTEYTEEGSLSICRKVPDLKYICEHDNRLWGCSEDTIYVSKPGDPFNWYVYDGLESDAWTLKPLSAGPFTGVTSYRGYVTFFKEDYVYKIYGSVPSNFQAVGTAALGLLDGCSKSLAIAGETLFYLGRSGIMAYTGGIPQLIGQELGAERFVGAVAGSDGLKYYVCLQDMTGRWQIYVYDTQRRLWHKEDNTKVLCFVRWSGALCYLNAEGEVWVIDASNIAAMKNPPATSSAEPDTAWLAEFADFTENDPNHKGVSKLQLRLEIEAGAQVHVHIQFDSDGVWHHVRSITGVARKRSYYLPITPRRCDHYRIRLSGTGMCKVYSMTRESYSGSEFKTWR